MSVIPSSPMEAVEYAVIGTMLQHGVKRPVHVRDLLAIATPADYVNPTTQAIAQAISNLTTRGEAVELVSVWTECQAMGGAARDAVASPQAIGAIVEFALWQDWDAIRHAKTIARESSKRKALLCLSGATKQLETPGVSAELCSEPLRAAMCELEVSHNGDLPEWTDTIATFVARLKSGEVLRPVPTPWVSLNSVLRGGICPGELAIVAARPSTGKTAIALNMGMEVAHCGHPVVFVSLEMGASELLARVSADIAGVEYGMFRDGLAPHHADAVADAMNRTLAHRVHVIDKARQTVLDIRQQVMAAKRKHGYLGMVVIDYLQLVQAHVKAANREREVAEMSREFKLLAKEAQCPVVLLAQLNRQVEQSNRDPQMSDLRESGSIEQDSDIVLFLHGKGQPQGGLRRVKLIVAKGRSSGTGSVDMVLDGRYQRFMEDDGTLIDPTPPQEDLSF